MLVAESADARAEELLGAHLTPAQRAEYAALGRITVVKRGVVWSVLAREVAKVLPLAALISVPALRDEAIFLLVTVVVALVPYWLPRVAVASARRREWIVSPRTSPVVVARGRKTRFCVAFREFLPDGDRVLAWKHLLELNEGHFLREANVRATWRDRGDAARCA